MSVEEKLRFVTGRLCLRISILLIFLYMIVPSSWVKGIIEGFPSGANPMAEVPDEFVPNIVHFIRFGEKNMTFIDAVCMLAALKNQKPQMLWIHTDQLKYDEVWGKYWKVVVNHPTAKGVVKVKYLRMPRSIFGKPLSPTFLFYHASDVERLRVLIEHGGIYLDNDSYLVKSLEQFFKFEMTLGWESAGGISDQVLMAKRNSEFLRKWLESYKDYRQEMWFYNAGEVPTRMLKKHPQLAFSVREKFAEYKTVPHMLYYKDDSEWKNHFAIHLLINHQYMLHRNISALATYPVEFNETNILWYPVNIRQMALDVYPFAEEIKKRYEAHDPILESMEHSR